MAKTAIVVNPYNAAVLFVPSKTATIDDSTGNVDFGAGSVTAASFTGAFSGSAAAVAGGAAGKVLYQSAPSTTGFTAAGATGQFLISGGTGAPTWTSNFTMGSSGTNLGLGSSAYWGVGYPAIDMGGVGSIEGDSAGTNFSLNAYYDGSTWRYKTTGNAMNIGMGASGLGVTQAASGSAGAALSLVQSLGISFAGNVTIATPTSGVGLTVNGTGADNTAVFNQNGIGLGATYGAMVANAHFTGTWQYLGAGAAWGIGNNFGGPTNGLTFAMAAVGAGGGTVTWTTPFTIANAGNVSINAPSSGTALTVVGLGSSYGNAMLIQAAGGGAGGAVLSIQDTTSSCNLTASSAGASAYFGTNTNNGLNIQTNNTSRIAIAAAGNVSINAPSSGTALTVVGLGSSYGNAMLIQAAGGGAGGAVLSIQDTTSSCNLTAYSAGASAYFGTNTNNGLNIQTNNTSRIAIAAAGNVSINAPSSGTALVVTGANIAGQPSVRFSTGDNTSNISLDITGSTNNACTVRLLNSGYSQVNYQMFADNTQAQIGTFVNTPLNIATNGTNRVQITAGGVTAVNLDAIGSYYEVGLRDLVFNNQSGASYTLVLNDRGKLVNATNAGPSNFTVPNAIFSAGNVVTILNNSSTAMTITQGASMTMYNCANSATGNRTLAGHGVATIVFTASNQCYISGAGLT